MLPTAFTERMQRLLGEEYTDFYRAMTEGTPESRARAARTFRIGYAALEGKDFTRH